jgi:hypothetical protein
MEMETSLGFHFQLLGPLSPWGLWQRNSITNTVHFRGDNGGGATMCVEQAGAAVLDIAVENARVG